MKLDKTPGLDLPKAGTPSIKPKRQTGESYEKDFETFVDFATKYPLDEITVPVSIVPPDDEDDYWLIQIALPMKNIVVDCLVWNATTHEVSKYRTRAFRQYKLALGLNDQLAVKGEEK